MPELEKKQLFNLGSILESSELFSNEGKIDFSYPSLDKKTVVLESGHQPNFLAHAGLMKKMFLLDHFKKKCESKGKKGIALFGFSDYDQCTSKLLTQNKLPAINKHGFEKIGFKIKGDEVWKRLDHIDKPTPDEWKKEIGKITSHYKKYSKSPIMEKNLDYIIDKLDESYKDAKNFPDINAFFLAKFSTEILGLNLIFFRYSDIQRRNIFLDEWKRIIVNIKNFNELYNKSISTFGLDIPLCTSDSLPFWYHCQCGAKVNLTFNEGIAAGRCMLCSKDQIFSIEKLEEEFKYLSPNAVARNIIFSEGMCTKIFISGSGGSLVYGKISDEISNDLGFHKPFTVSWKSKDYYPGIVHLAAIDQLEKLCRPENGIFIPENIGKTIKERKEFLLDLISKAKETGNNDHLKKYEGQYKNLVLSIEIFKSVCKVTPSFIDVFVSQSFEHIKELWSNTLIDIDLVSLIEKDIVYENNDIINMYKNMEDLNAQENISTQPTHR